MVCIWFLEQSERSIKHVCTTALLCPFYRFLTGTKAISAQLVGSILGFIINMILTMGIIHQAATLLFIWLVSCELYVNIFCLLTKSKFWIHFLRYTNIYTLHVITGWICGWHMRLHHSLWNHIKCLACQTTWR